MGATILITLREGIEVALILSIVMAYLRKIGRQDAFKQVWIGMAAAFGLAALIGFVAYKLIGGLEGNARSIVFAGVSLGAVVMLTWMLFWMRAQARTMSRQLREQVDEAIKSGSTWGIASVAFFTVLRDGIETVLFMLAILFGTSPMQWILGMVIGLSTAAMLGYMIYQGGRRINIGLFFNFTGGMVIFIGAGLFSRGIAWLQESGVLPTFLWPVWNVSDVAVIGHGQVALLFGGLFGWNPRPSIEEVAVWTVYLIVFGYFYFFAGRSKSQSHPAKKAAPAGQKA
jgi:high-affinity iron transporter